MTYQTQISAIVNFKILIWIIQNLINVRSKETEFTKCNIGKCDFSESDFTKSTFKLSNFGENNITKAIWKKYHFC
ncbi:MAG: pentapeptide repeat-containing protein [Saprospiraceae bacterium]|nr:pentapeptide repeat-containing protein [Candidatus Defluviibacterium haderslevense]